MLTVRMLNHLDRILGNIAAEVVCGASDLKGSCFKSLAQFVAANLQDLQDASIGIFFADEIPSHVVVLDYDGQILYDNNAKFRVTYAPFESAIYQKHGFVAPFTLAATLPIAELEAIVEKHSARHCLTTFGRAPARHTAPR